jgi:hypothetical protein
MHYNMCPHIANFTMMTLATVSWGIMNHPRYSSDLRPVGFELLWPLKEYQGGQILKKHGLKHDVENWLCGHGMSMLLASVFVMLMAKLCHCIVANILKMCYSPVILSLVSVCSMSWVVGCSVSDRQLELCHIYLKGRQRGPRWHPPQRDIRALKMWFYALTSYRYYNGKRER